MPPFALERSGDRNQPEQVIGFARIRSMSEARKIDKNQHDGTALGVSELLTLLAEKDRQLAEKDQQLSDTQHVLNNKNHIIREQQKRIAIVEAYLRLAKIQRFGSSSEKLPFQADIFDEAELDVALGDLAEQLPEDEDVVRKTRPKTRKRGFSDALARLQIHLRLSDEEKQGATKTFFTKVKEELDIIPAQARVLEYWQEKAVFEQDGEPLIKAAQRPVHPLGKCKASPSLLAHIVASKEYRRYRRPILICSRGWLIKDHNLTVYDQRTTSHWRKGGYGYEGNLCRS